MRTGKGVHAVQPFVCVSFWTSSQAAASTVSRIDFVSVSLLRTRWPPQDH